MKIFIGACLLLSDTVASCQLHWEKSKEWTLYRYQGHRLFKIPLDSLQSFDSSPLDKDSMAIFLDTFKSLHPEAPIAWMGGYIATCKLDGVIRKIEISNYGGFFFDEKTKSYFELPLDKRERWQDYLQQTYLDLTRRRASPK